ncbi:MAG: hypothetical protein MHM6MM_005892 [Cercozoa sp. M6MM]
MLPVLDLHSDLRDLQGLASEVEQEIVEEAEAQLTESQLHLPDFEAMTTEEIDRYILQQLALRPSGASSELTRQNGQSSTLASSFSIVFSDREARHSRSSLKHSSRSSAAAVPTNSARHADTGDLSSIASTQMRGGGLFDNMFRKTKSKRKDRRKRSSSVPPSPISLATPLAQPCKRLAHCTRRRRFRVARDQTIPLASKTTQKNSVDSKLEILAHRPQQKSECLSFATNFSVLSEAKQTAESAEVTFGVSTAQRQTKPTQTRRRLRRDKHASRIQQVEKPGSQH